MREGILSVVLKYLKLTYFRSYGTSILDFYHPLICHSALALKLWKEILILYFCIKDC